MDAADTPPTSRHVARGAGTALLARAGGAIEIVSQPLYVLLFGLPTYGLYTVLWAAVNLTENIFDMGMTNALQRVVPQAKDDAERADALRSAMIAGVGPCLIVALLASLAAPWIAPALNVAAKDAGAVVTGIRIFAWALPFWAYVEIATSALRSRKAFGPEIRLRILWEQVMRMIAATVLWAMGAGALGLLIAHITSLAITCILSTRLLKRYYRLDLALVPAGPAMFKKTLVAGVSVLPSNIIGRLFADAPPLILNMMIPGAAGASASGLFAIARKIASAVQLIRQAFSYVMAPLASEAVRHDKRAVTEIYAFATRLTTIVALPIVCGLIGTGSAILGLFGPAGQAAWWPFALLTIARLIEAIAGGAGAIQNVISRYHHPLYGAVFGLITSLVLMAFLLPEGGIIGMGIAVSAGIIVSDIVPVWMLWRHDHVQPFEAPYARVATISTLISLAILGLTFAASPLPDAPRLIGGVILIFAGIWGSGRFGLPESDKLAMGKTARKLRLI